MTVGRSIVEQMEAKFRGTPDVSTTRELTPPRFTLLEPVKTTNDCEVIITSDPLEVLLWIGVWCPRGTLTAFDVETRGTRSELPDTEVVGFSLATGGSSIYLDCTGVPGGFGGMGVRDLLHLLIKRDIRLLAHNWFFDARWILRDHPAEFEQLNMHRCTYLSYKVLATEGWANQSWSLKRAQTELLGWTETNEVGLDRWLIENGWVTGSVTKQFSESMSKDERWRYYQSDDNLDSKGAKKVRPAKGEMWRAPADILGHYCCLDSHSTWLLYTNVLSPIEGKFAVLPDYLNRWMTVLRLLVRQYDRGIELSIDQLRDAVEEWEQKCSDAYLKFITHPDVAPHAAAWFETEMKRNYWDREPPKYRKPPKEPKEPPQYRKDGELSKNWIKWNEVNRPKYEHAIANPTVSKNWEAWVERRSKVEQESKFNLNSNDQLCWLFYDQLKYPVAKETENGERSIDKKVVGLLGEPGRLLREYGIVEKERQYMLSALETQYEGVIYPQFRVPGTLTGRLAGSGGWNCFPPKEVECLTRDGWKWIEDITDGEEVVSYSTSADELQWEKASPIISESPYQSLIEINGIRMTANHRVPVFGAANQSHRYLETVEASQLVDYPRRSIKRSATLKEGTKYPIDEIWAACAVQADGSLRRDRPNVYIFGVNKEIKAEKLRYLFGKETNRYGKTWTWAYTRFESELLSGCKEKRLHLTKICRSQAEEVLAAIAFWDGYTVRTEGTRVEYSTTNEYNANQIFSYFSTAGYSTFINKYGNCWRVYITKRIYSDIKATYLGESPYYAHYCISVPSGNLLLRANRRNVILGNCQQQPKAAKYLECFRARPGYRWVQCDVTSLEKVVLTERSRDAALLNIYGPGAKPNDIYLFDGAHLPGFKEDILAAGYDPFNTTAEMISMVKSKCKSARKKVKSASLGFGYGLGPKKYRDDMLALGYEMTEEEARAVHRAYWNLYKGTKEWERELKRQWRKNRGWILNGIGRPLGIHDDYLHDVVNRDTQSTGHDLLIYWITLFVEALDAEGIEWYPIILDFHDESIIEVRESEAERAAEIMDESFTKLNEMMGALIPLTGDGMICDTLADVKIEE